MTPEEYERIWQWIELSNQAIIEYQIDKCWEFHDARMGPAPIQVAARTIRESNLIAEHQRHQHTVVEQSRHLP